MKYLIGTIFTLSIGVWNSAYAQNLEVIGAAGTTSGSSAGSISYTVGEAIIFSAGNSTNHVTQGFHQGNIYVTGIEEERQLQINVFPNPSSGLVNIQVDEAMSMIVYDMAGRNVFSEMNITDFYQFNTSELTRGTYTLVFQNSNEIKQSVKLVVL